MVERILSNYRDVDDKANQALKDKTESEVFKSKKSTFDTLMDLLDSED